MADEQISKQNNKQIFGVIASILTAVLSLSVSAAAAIVIDILVPVSPSGTGKIFKALISSFCFKILLAPEINAFL